MCGLLKLQKKKRKMTTQKMLDEAIITWKKKVHAKICFLHKTN